jgi:nitroimidazol reductase NimA-like FMN-containing flavoprotein (pyridoxamine 5'-phosphate oxidase superfamily)
MTTPPSTDRVRIRRSPERGVYDEQAVHAILDAAMVCHLGYVADGQPYVVPTLYGRDGSRVIVHGSSASRAMRTGATMPVCVTVTHLDGIVLARSLFHHSANYRSVVVLGQASLIDDAQEKVAGLRVLTEHVVPGRWDEARAPNDKELRATTLLALDLAESSAKVRTGPPEDEAEDLGLDVWAGELPLEVVAGTPLPEPALAAGIDVPPSVARWVPGPQRHDGGRATT